MEPTLDLSRSLQPQPTAPGPPRSHAPLRQGHVRRLRRALLHHRGSSLWSVAAFDWVSWRPASSWQELPAELGEVTKAEEEVAQPRSGLT